jgi:hypothetical protein
VEEIAGPSVMDVARAETQSIGRILFRDRWQGHHLPVLLAEDVADEIVLVQTLLDDDDRALGLVVEATVEGVVVELGDPSTFRLRQRRE